MRTNLFRLKLASFRLDRTISQRRFSISEAALLLMTAYIASRLLGVVRQTIFNAAFGTGPQANAFFAAVQLPDTLFNLIAGGALTYAFIPVFISYETENGQMEAWRLASLVFNVLLVALTALTLLGEWLAPAFVDHLLVPGYSPSQQALVTTLTRIMLVQPLILGLSTVATAILSSKRRFLLPALSIGIYNFGLIGGLLCSLAMPKVGIYGPTFGLLVSSVFQAFIQVPGLRKEGGRYSFTWDLRNKGLHQVMRLLLPNILAVGIYSGVTIMSTAFVSFFPDQVSLSALHNASLLFAVPVSLFAQAIGQAAIPRMSQLAASARFLHLRLLVFRVIGVALLISILCAVGLVLLGRPTIRLLFQHGAFTQHSTQVTALALLGYAVGLPASVAIELFVRSYYALKDAYTPLLIDILAMAARFGLILLFLKWMAGPYMIMAIPLANSVSATAQTVLLGALLSLRLRKGIKTDKGLARLRRMSARNQADKAAQKLDEEVPV